MCCHPEWQGAYSLRGGEVGSLYVPSRAAALGGKNLKGLDKDHNSNFPPTGGMGCELVRSRDYSPLFGAAFVSSSNTDLDPPPVSDLPEEYPVS